MNETLTADDDDFWFPANPRYLILFRITGALLAFVSIYAYFSKGTGMPFLLVIWFFVPPWKRKRTLFFRLLSYLNWALVVFILCISLNYIVTELGSSLRSQNRSDQVKSTVIDHYTSDHTETLGPRLPQNRGGFSICPPLGWLVVEETNDDFIGVAIKSEGYAPNVTLVKDRYPSTPAAFEAMVRSEPAVAKRTRIEPTLLSTQKGTQVTRVLTERFHPKNGYDMRYTFYLIYGRHGKDYLFTFTSPVVVADQFQNIADDYVLSFVEQ